MNPDYNQSSKDEADIKDTVLHESGHAIACVHEQESSSFPAVTWNKDKVYAYFKDQYNWDQTKVNNNFNNFQPGSKAALSATPKWDGKSIMQYEIRPEWTKEGIGRGSD